mgnify:CR=1 FL=1
MGESMSRAMRRCSSGMGVDLRSARSMWSRGLLFLEVTPEDREAMIEAATAALVDVGTP